MRFRLTYSGRLNSSGNKSKNEQKWEVRNHIHSQLEELWNLHPVLQGHSISSEPVIDPNGYIMYKSADEEQQRVRNRNLLREPILSGSHRFLPLVRKSLFLTCSLDILFLRKDEPGYLFNKKAGDLDGRLKTLLDGLCMPTLGLLQGGEPVGDPSYCLVEDDHQITDISIRTDRLLSYPRSSEHEVHLVIEVSVTPIRAENNFDFYFWKKW